jgi:CheY-like chemotaxis protein
VELVRANSGEEALRALLQADFALILLDAQMPGMDGFETAAQIKARERTQHIPIVFLTAVDEEQQHAYRGYAAGGADYLSKPFDPWVLRAKVQVFVDLWLAGRRLATQAALLQRGLEGRVGVVGELDDRLGMVEESVATLRERAGDDEAVETLARRVAALRQALDVLDDESSPSGATRREFG